MGQADKITKKYPIVIGHVHRHDSLSKKLLIRLVSHNNKIEYGLKQTMGTLLSGQVQGYHRGSDPGQ